MGGHMLLESMELCRQNCELPGYVRLGCSLRAEGRGAEPLADSSTTVPANGYGGPPSPAVTNSAAHPSSSSLPGHSSVKTMSMCGCGDVPIGIPKD